MKKPNSNFWKMVGKYIALPLLLYFSILLFCLVTNHRLWLYDIVITEYIPGLTFIAVTIWMWVEHHSMFVRWAVDLWGDWIKNYRWGKYTMAFHVWSSMLLMAVLWGSMFGIHFFVANRISIRQIEKFDVQTDISNDIRIVVDDLVLDSSLVTIIYDISSPSSKYMSYKIITADVYRCVKNRPDVWFMSSDSVRVDKNILLSDSVINDYVDIIYKKVITSKPQHAQSYRVDKIDYAHLIANMQQAYEKKYGEKTFPQRGAVYMLSTVNDLKKHLMLIIIVPFIVLFLFFLYRLSIFEDKINNEDYEKPI